MIKSTHTHSTAAGQPRFEGSSLPSQLRSGGNDRQKGASPTFSDRFPIETLKEEVCKECHLLHRFVRGIQESNFAGAQEIVMTERLMAARSCLLALVKDLSISTKFPLESDSLANIKSSLMNILVALKHHVAQHGSSDKQLRKVTEAIGAARKFADGRQRS
jgi:hypothetical protein